MIKSQKRIEKLILYILADRRRFYENLHQSDYMMKGNINIKVGDTREKLVLKSLSIISLVNIFIYNGYINMNVLLKTSYIEIIVLALFIYTSLVDINGPQKYNETRYIIIKSG